MQPERRRFESRSRWAIAVRTLSTQEAPLMGGSPESRLRAVHELSECSWRLSGHPLPDYARAQAPVRMLETFLGRSARR